MSSVQAELPSDTDFAPNAGRILECETCLWENRGTEKSRITRAGWVD